MAYVKHPQELPRSLERAAAPYAPGGGLIYVPVGQQQGVLGQTFYGNTMKNIPVGQTSLFSPGIPLPPQPNVDPQGKPVQWRFPVAWNTFSVDRTLAHPDIPPFEQLRNLARMYSGCTLCERYWFDMVPRMTLDIRLKKEYLDQGAEPKNYQKEISFFKNFWAKPDGKHDLHTWLRMALREQMQVDELYLYKNRTRGGKLLGLWITAGDQMKPLLDDWGMQPDAPDYAYQQYPWGIPGMQYSTDMMIHYQETPAANNPFGQSRVERIILEVNQALRKKKKDLNRFTEGNIPQSFMKVPEGLNWTPDQIDAFEQSWNALLAGNPQWQVRMKFLQPGMDYLPVEEYEINFDPDTFLFKIACGNYGVPITEFSFTEDSNRSSGESQEDVVYRRTIEPNAIIYSGILTTSMAEDFPEELHGEMFEAYLGGYEEVDDEKEKSETLATYTGAGILGLTDAAKLANLPIDPDAPPIGRIIMTKTGPVFLDDIATPEMRKAQQQATMAGYQLAANPPAPSEAEPEEDEGEGEEPPPGPRKAKSPAKAAKKQPPEDKATLTRLADVLERAEETLRLAYTHTQGIEDEQRAQTETEGASGRGSGSEGTAGRENLPAATRAASDGAVESGALGPDSDSKALSAEYRRWRSRALEDAKAGRVQRPFTSNLIPEPEHATLTRALWDCKTPEEVRAVFEQARTFAPVPILPVEPLWQNLVPRTPSNTPVVDFKPITRTAEDDGSPKAPVASGSEAGGNLEPSRSAWKLRW